MSETKVEFWGVVEVMGYQAYAGRISEQEIAGAAMLRVDVPEADGRAAFTKFLGAAAIYAITPLTEELARAKAATLRKEPIDVWSVSDALRRLPAVPGTGVGIGEAADLEDDEGEPGDDSDPEW